jgi:uncharacterized Zn finger protein (UPF0148 family)
MLISEKHCPVCGTSFFGRTDKAFCSAACRVRAYRHRQTDDLIEVEIQEDSPVESTGGGPEYSTALVLAPPPVPSLPVASTGGSSGRVDYLQQWREEEAARKLDRQRQEELLQAQKAHKYYEEVIESFLYYEGQKLPEEELEELLASALDGVKHYKSHPGLKEPNSDARHRLNDLRDAVLLLRNTWQDAQSRTFTGRKACYELPKKWRKQLRERLLE